MDLNDYWQENKRFVTSVAGGVVVFLVGLAVVDSVFGEDLVSAERKKGSLESNLRKEMYTSEDLAEARTENEGLVEAVERLGEFATFRPREEFILVGGAGSASSQYLRTLTRVRDELIPRANRANLKLDDDLGMPKLSPTRDDEILRYLEALDVIETTVGIAIGAGVRRIDDIQVRLDPGFGTRVGTGRIERTRIVFTMSGPSLPLTRLLAATQAPPDGRVLMVDEVEMRSARNKPGEGKLTLTLIVARLHEPEPEEEAS